MQQEANSGTGTCCRYNPKIRVLWAGVIIVAVLNFVVVFNENILYQEMEMDGKNTDTDRDGGEFEYTSTSSAPKRLERSIKRKHLNNRPASDSLQKASKHDVTIQVNDSHSEVVNVSLNRTAHAPTIVPVSGLSRNETKRKELPFVPRRTLTCNGCFRSSFRYSGGEHICRSIRDGSPEQVDIFIIITTSYTHMRNRATLRKTWLTRTRDNTAKVRYAFFFGETDNNQLRKYVAREAERYRDVIIIDFLDSYSNLTYKTIAAFKWVLTNCAQTRFVMKTDDDMFVNIGNLIGLTTRFRGLLQTRVLGSCKKQSPVRVENSKYYVPYNVYPFSDYPPVCSATGYVTSIRVIEKIVQTSPNIPYFPLEDVYVAMCLDTSGLGTRRYQGFLSTVPSTAPLCIFKGRIVITGHIRSWRTIEEIWNLECGAKDL